MALVQCVECGKEISSNAVSCPHCGNPPKVGPGPNENGRFCPRCQIVVTPMVTSVAGGSCTVGKRETWKCPKCTRILYRSGCFVATVTYGDEDVVEVRFLRAFRDEVLSNNIMGRCFVWAYYKMSPFIAKTVEIIPIAKGPCRKILDIVVRQIEKRTHLTLSNFRDPLR